LQLVLNGNDDQNEVIISTINNQEFSTKSYSINLDYQAFTGFFLRFESRLFEADKNNFIKNNQLNSSFLFHTISIA
jgi:hypothetical protein